MKGIIAEIDGNRMIVIAKNGDFVKCKKLPNLNIGDEVNIPRVNMTSVYKKMSAVAASFLIFAMLSTGVYAYYTPYSYVSVDINPSLELSVNRFEKVIGVHAFNEEAEKVLGATDKIKNKEIDDALEEIINTASEQGYLQRDASNSLMIVVSSSNEKEETALTAKVSEASTQALANISNDYEVILEKTQLKDYKNAKKQNVSPGKLILASKFKEADPNIDEEQIIRMPLQQAIKQIEKKNPNAEKPDKPKVEPANDNNKPKMTSVRVKNVKDMIIERNEDLGKKLINQGNGNGNGKDKQQNDNSTLSNDNQGNNSNDKDKSADDNDKDDNKKQPEKKDNKKK